MTGIRTKLILALGPKLFVMTKTLSLLCKFNDDSELVNVVSKRVWEKIYIHGHCDCSTLSDMNFSGTLSSRIGILENLKTL